MNYKLNIYQCWRMPCYVRKSLIVCLVLTYFYLVPASSQIFFHDSGDISTNEEITALVSAIRTQNLMVDEKVNIKRLDILEVGDDKYLAVDGKFSLYKWENNHWEDKYMGHFFGYNFGSKKFVYKDKICSYGGYGFWKVNNDLIEFDEKIGGWELVTIPRFNSSGFGLIYLHNEKLHILNDRHTELDLKARKYSDFGITYKKPIFDGHYPHNLTVIETNNYVVDFLRPYGIIDKRNNLQYSSQLAPFIKVREALHQGRGLCYSRGDSIFMWSEELGRAEFSCSVEAELSKYQPAEIRKSSKVWYLMLFLILSFLGLVFWRRRNRSIQLSESEIVHPLFKALVTQRGQTLSTEELDAIFKISEIVPDESKRFKRSQIIKEINSESKLKTNRQIIHRIKDPEDKRRYKYEINYL